jgi:hypothetical protein
MRRIRTPLIVIAFLTTLSTGARQIEEWSYDRLFKEADLVVIASAGETVRTDDKPVSGQWSASLIGQVTPFKTRATLKGKLPTDAPLRVLHFVLKEGVTTQDGPLLIAFRTQPVRVEGCGTVKYKAGFGPPDYLLFLRARADGRFEPVSGETDPALSIKEIYAPLPSVMDGR